MSSDPILPRSVETPGTPPSAPSPRKKSLIVRATSSMPLLATVVVHLVLIAIAGAVVVQQNRVGKKKTFEASAASEGATKQVEHRLQVARRGGASGGATSPVSVNRIQSTATSALAMPEMPELPSAGAGGFGGFGGMGSGVGLGAGTGIATSLGGGTGLGGRGFISLSFLGATSQNASKIVFVVDTSSAIMDLRKGGFRAFGIIREEIMRLVGRLPPSAQFNVVLFSGSGGTDDGRVEVNLYEKELVAATTENKKDFFAWLAPVNSQLNSYGPFSAARRTTWRKKPLSPESGVDPLFLPPVWSRAVHAALEMEPDTVYVITASQGGASRRADEATIAKRKAAAEKAQEEFAKDAAREGMDPAAIRTARDRAYAKAAAEFAAASRRLVEAGKDPIVIGAADRIFRSDVQALLRRNGIKIELDTQGWTKKDGTPFRVPYAGHSNLEPLPWEDFVAYLARVQRALLRERAALNLFLFVGPEDKPDEAVKNLTTVAKRNGGSFQLLTTSRLEELKARDEAK